MSQEEESQTISMVVLTSILRPPPTRIGRLGPVNLGRTFPLVNSIGALLGGLLGLVVVLVSLGPDPLYLAYGLVAGGGLGIVAVTWSPLPGESLAKWPELMSTVDRQECTSELRPSRAWRQEE